MSRTAWRRRGARFSVRARAPIGRRRWPRSPTPPCGPAAGAGSPRYRRRRWRTRARFLKAFVDFRARRRTPSVDRGITENDEVHEEIDIASPRGRLAVRLGEVI